MATDPTLFELRNNFLLGNFQGAVNEANKISPYSDSIRVERDSYLYRSYIAQGNYQNVLDEIPSNANAQLRAVRLLAQYLANEAGRDSVVEAVKELLRSNAALPVAQVIAATIYANEKNFEEAMRAVHQSTSLEGLALLVQLYLKIDRPELAEKELHNMQKFEDGADDTATQLATAWVHISQGGDKFEAALFILRDLAEKYGASGMLLNAQAVCNLHLGKLDVAERLLLSATEKNAKDADTLVNLIALSLHARKSQEVVNRYVNQLKSIAPKHPWVEALRNADDSFERAQARFAI